MGLQKTDDLLLEKLNISPSTKTYNGLSASGFKRSRVGVQPGSRAQTLDYSRPDPCNGAWYRGFEGPERCHLAKGEGNLCFY